MNRILSVLATVLKGSMLFPVCACLSQLKWLWYHRTTQTLDDFEVFDAASRGPLGAALLLYRLKFWHLASIGSVVTLLSLASDAFIQQSLQFPEASVNSTAFILIAQSYSKGSDSPIDGAIEVEQSFIPALYNGILASDLSQSSSAVSPTCSTGNCTFLPYASLAVCSACTEVTALLNSSELDPAKPGEPYLGGTQLFSLPNGFYSEDIDSSFTGLNISTLHNLNTDDLPSYQPRLFNVSTIWGAYHTVPRAHQAFDCVFYFCVQTFSGSVVQNHLTESVRDVYHDPKLEAVSVMGERLSLNMTIPQGHLLPPDINRTFNVGPTMIDLSHYLSQQLIGAGGIDVTGQSIWENDVVHGIFSQNSSNFERTMGNLATAVTNAMRTISGDSAVGTACRNLPFSMSAGHGCYFLWP
ncbi:hypothetical protein GJ744_006786 [Endocarpon pusillum]|uniref:Uncharacterized protein n=1 Tax=Endocarpon pusillum TaxID=364733 RepID=A0A8H7ASD8_9EURO|nr:hypothetical protein GJ744_006786 [Endocarpon pusillum]